MSTADRPKSERDRRPWGTGVVVIILTTIALSGLVVFRQATGSPTCGANAVENLIGRNAAQPNQTGTYAETSDGFNLNYDLYLPKADNPPVVMYVHGGGWSALSRALPRQSPPMALCDRGYAIVSIDYRLTSDGAVWPDPGTDVLLAARFLSEGGIDDVDLSRVAFWGDSAGGHLASWAATVANQRSEAGATPNFDGSTDSYLPTVRGVIGGAAITDFTDPNFATWSENIDRSGRAECASDASCGELSEHWPCSAPGQVECTNVIENVALLLFGCRDATIDDCGHLADQAGASDASPVAHVDGCDPPHLLLADDQPLAFDGNDPVGDMLVPPSQQTLLADALLNAGVDDTRIRWTTGSGHIAITEEPEIIDELDRFLTEVFASRPRPACS